MAGSIKLFQLVLKCHQSFGIHPRQQNPEQKRLSSNSIRAIFLTSMAQFIFTTVVFLLFDAKSMFDYGFVFYLLITLINSLATYLIFIWESENILEFIGNCEGFIEKRPHSKATYKETIEKIELFNKFLWLGTFNSLFLGVCSLMPFSFVRYYIFDMGEDSFYLFVPAWMPFDWKTPFGYLVPWLGLCAGSAAVICIYGQFINVLFGSCWLFIFIAEDITQDVAAFNFVSTTTKSDENRTELKKRFCDMVQIYSDAKQCVMEFNCVFKYSLFAFFSWILLGLSSLLATIQFELWADDSNLLEIAIEILVLIWVTLVIYLLCEPGARTTHQFKKFNDELNQYDWYLLSIELQRCYIVFVSDTQNPINVMSYANIVCERETSKKLITKAFSYFMTLRKFKP